METTLKTVLEESAQHAEWEGRHVEAARRLRDVAAVTMDRLEAERLQTHARALLLKDALLHGI